MLAEPKGRNNPALTRKQMDPVLYIFQTAKQEGLFKGFLPKNAQSLLYLKKKLGSAPLIC